MNIKCKEIVNTVVLVASLLCVIDVITMQEKSNGDEAQIISDEVPGVELHVKKHLTLAEEKKLSDQLFYAKIAQDVNNLLAQKANIGVWRLKDGMTPLMRACYFCKDENGFERVKALIECKSDVNKRDYQGNTALHWAAAGGWGHEGVVSLLLKYGGGIDICNSEGETALRKAEQVCPSMAALLRKLGASSEVFFNKKARVPGVLKVISK